LQTKAAHERAVHEETMFSARDVNRFLSGFAAAARAVEIHFRWRPQLTDPSDEFVLEAAVNAGGVPLVTHNIRDFAIATERFNLLVLTPGQFLRKLMS
jgi:predicted nucleic acid-binding protein